MSMTLEAKQTKTRAAVAEFMENHFKHFNARETLDAAKAYRKHIDGGGKMFLALAGAMSTAELGIILARMIRENKVHAISSTAANFEEDLFKLFGYGEYKNVPHYKDLTPDDEVKLRDAGFNRVTDTCIPEAAMRLLEKKFLTPLLAETARQGESRFLWEHIYSLLDEGEIQKYFKGPIENSWVVAAWEKGIPVYTPGWEDSTMGNMFAARVYEGKIKTHNVVRTGTEQMEHLARWYIKTTKETTVGFFQIGGGIAGDFAICVVPMIIQDLKVKTATLWSYFAQISDSATSYGSYSGAVPNEKITWFKIAPETPRFMIQSDATLVAPLIFSYVLGM